MSLTFWWRARGIFVPHRSRRRNCDISAYLPVELLEVRQLLSGISLKFDFTFDTNNFFDSQAKKDLMDQAALVYESGQTGSTINPLGISDQLAAIQPGSGNTWSAIFTNPGTGNPGQTVENLSIADGTLLVYVGGRALGSTSTLAEGGPGGFNAFGSQEWLDTIKGRGQAGTLVEPKTDFGPWGGAITFNSSVNWFFGSTTAGLAGSGKTDFFTVAVHELGHMLGFGTSDSFSAKVSGNNFTGTHAVAAYDFSGNVPLSSDKGHWAQSVTDGGAEAMMTPAVAANTRKAVTDLDYAALQDVGWTFSTGNQRMYRAYNPTADYHFFTISFPEFANAVANGYRDESSGQPGFAVPDSHLTGTVPIHRLYNPNNGRHYYTYNDGERDSLVSVGWRYEKDEGNIYTAQVSGSTEIFRLYNNNSGTHLYTESAAQKDAILAQFPGICVQHSSLGFAFAVAGSGAGAQSAASQSQQTVAADPVPMSMDDTSASGPAPTFQAISWTGAAIAPPLILGGGDTPADGPLDDLALTPRAPLKIRGGVADTVGEPCDVRGNAFENAVPGIDHVFSNWTALDD